MNTNSNNHKYAPLRTTRQREVILRQVQQSSDHPTADVIYRRVREIIPNISLGTVYRNLEVLVDKGIIRELRLCCHKRRFDGGMHRHYHVRCIKCGRVCDVSPQAIPDLDGLVQRRCNFEILAHDLEFEGLCPACKGTGGGVEQTELHEVDTNGLSPDSGGPGRDEIQPGRNPQGR